MIRAPDNITSLGAKIELLAFSDGISRPDFLVTAQEVVDGENVAVALYMHINKDYLVVEYGYFSESVSGSDFYNALVVPLLYIDAEGVLGSSGFVAESQFTPFGLRNYLKTHPIADKRSGHG